VARCSDADNLQIKGDRATAFVIIGLQMIAYQIKSVVKVMLGITHIEYSPGS
jgi:hypothetical protein